MHIFGVSWRDGYLDYHRHESEVRIRVRVWWPLGSLENVYSPQPRSLKRVWNYIREVGVVQTLRKIRSRMAERLRDRRVIAVGIGEIADNSACGEYRLGDPVVFVAPCHPYCVERVVLPLECLRPLPKNILERLADPHHLLLRCTPPGQEAPDWTQVAGWSRFSGIDIKSSIAPLLSWAVQEFSADSFNSARKLPLARATPVVERAESARETDGNPTAVVFGLGHYAKTCVIPNLDPRIRISCIHEIDPTQIGVINGSSVIYDTSPELRPDERYDIHFIAGYHHTHADLAVRAITDGAWAVVEKPLVTTEEQLERLLAACAKHPGRMFAGFHMRFNPLWQLARQDLALKQGEPVHYHCITYEIPLVRNHWYNWPNSKSRIVSNGCHWLDHFLFMNDFSRPIRHDLWTGGNRDLHVSVELENGAVFGMALTEIGSRRIGVQDHIQLRANGITIRVDNAGTYVAEDDSRILRRMRINKADSVKRLYRTCSRKILNNEPGDSIASIQRSCELMLQMEKLIQEQSPKPGRA